jgi:uncharacterized protein
VRSPILKFQLSDLAKLSVPLRLAAFMLCLGCLWLPFAVPIYLLVDDPNTESLLSLPILYGEFILLLRVLGLRVYQVPNLLWRYGLEFSRRSGAEWFWGFALGSGSLLGLFALEGVLGWVAWQSPSGSLVQVLLEGFLVAVAIGFAEELLFRGWLLEELQRDYSPTAAQWLSAVIFAMVHGFRFQLPALVLLGAALVWAKRTYGKEKLYLMSSLQTSRQGRLALPMGLHSGLVWAYYGLNVGQIITYTGQGPAWVTGLERNPLAGLLGIGFMAMLALGLRSLSARRRWKSV